MSSMQPTGGIRKSTRSLRQPALHLKALRYRGPRFRIAHCLPYGLGVSLLGPSSQKKGRAPCWTVPNIRFATMHAATTSHPEVLGAGFASHALVWVFFGLLASAE